MTPTAEEEAARTATGSESVRLRRELARIAVSLGRDELRVLTAAGLAETSR